MVKRILQNWLFNNFSAQFMKYLPLLIFLLIFNRAFPQPFQFYREKLDFSITQDEFMLDGLYMFRNNSADTVHSFLLYPFPQTPGLGEVTSVEVNSVYPKFSGKALTGFNQKAARFRVLIYPKDTAVVHVIYKQQIPNQNAEYILTSTQAWNRPLKRADFTLTIPMDTRIDSLSYDADSLLFTGGKVKYKWRFTDFMPERNFFVSFQKIHKK